jgi:hypothetical protein
VFVFYAVGRSSLVTVKNLTFLTRLATHGSERWSPFTALIAAGDIDDVED